MKISPKLESLYKQREIFSRRVRGYEAQANVAQVRLNAVINKIRNLEEKTSQKDIKEANHDKLNPNTRRNI